MIELVLPSADCCVGVAISGSRSVISLPTGTPAMVRV
jgi:hypothetical protein